MTSIEHHENPACHNWLGKVNGATLGIVDIKCPYGVPGDRLWVKETWKTCNVYDPYSPSQIDSGAAVKFIADGSSRLNGTELWGRVRQSIFMPRWASRITLEIVSVRVERLNDITEDDAKREGITLDSDYWPRIQAESLALAPLGARFAHLWNTINGEFSEISWQKNPWVFAVGFKRVEGGVK